MALNKVTSLASRKLHATRTIVCYVGILFWYGCNLPMFGPSNQCQPYHCINFMHVLVARISLYSNKSLSLITTLAILETCALLYSKQRILAASQNLHTFNSHISFLTVRPSVSTLHYHV
jgi:hypothetical protein